MRRARYTQNGISGSLDSLVDIVANSLGILVLVATLSVLGSHGMKIDLGTPIIREAPEGLERIDFECRENRVIPIDFSCVEPDRKAIHDSTASIEERRGMIRRFNERRVSSGFHWFELRERAIGGRLLTNTTLKPLDHPVGDTASDLKAPPCEFSRRLADLDPQTHFLTFYVQPDSFEVFRMARKLAKEQDFEVGWRPDDSDVLVFGPGGSPDTVD